MQRNLTRSGVCYNLKDSPWFVQRHDLVFYFSSNSHRIKFLENLRTKEDWLCDSLSRRFHIAINARLLACIQLYMQIEQRGMYIKALDGTVFRCQEEILLGGMQISRNA